MTNQAILKIPAGYGFKISASGQSAVRNFAKFGVRRNGELTSFGIIEPGVPQKEIKAFFTEVELIVEGFAGDYAASTIHPAFKVPEDLSIPVSVPYNDAYGRDRDYNDLLVHISRFHSIDIQKALHFKRDYLDSLELICLHPNLPKIENLLKKFDSGLEISLTDYSDLPVISSNLNDEEKKLFNKDPIIGARVLITAQLAINTAYQLYETKSLHNGNGDAFRHMYWNFLMSRSMIIGEVNAANWATAHESVPNNPSLEKIMDLHNNQIGRNIARSNINDNPQSLLEIVRKGDCRILKNGTLIKSDSNGEI